MNLRYFASAVAWHVRGQFSRSPFRELGFAARDALQLGEVRARKDMARELVEATMTIDRERGYVRLPADERFREIATVGSSVAGASTGQNMGGKEFFRARFASDDELAILLRTALDRRLLAAVARYLGTMPIICEADYYCSVPHGPPWSKSQLWHCDDDGIGIVKLFVYCEDVTADNGPFELVDAARSETARRAIGYRYAGRRYRVSDAVMDAHVPRADQLAFEGASTSGFMIDTSRCFHRGSRITARDGRRVAAIVTYVQPSSRRLPLNLERSGAPLARFASRFSDSFERAALGIPIA